MPPLSTTRKRRASAPDTDEQGQTAASTQQAKRQKSAAAQNTRAVGEQRKELTKFWLTKKALILKEDGSVFVAESIKKPKDEEWQLVAKATDPDTPRAIFTIDKERLRAEGIQQIIPDFMGGTFTGEGHRALVTRVLHRKPGYRRPRPRCRAVDAAFGH